MWGKDGKSIKQRMLLWLNGIRFSYKIRKKGKLFEITLPERYKRPVRWIKILATVIGLLSAFFAFESSGIAFLFGLGLYLLTSIVERILFSYTSMYIHPLPGFEIEKEKWLGSIFGFAQQDGNPHDIPVVGMILKDEDYARKIYSLLMAWTNGNTNDRDRHVCVSAVLVEDNSYIFFVYPSLDRKPAKRFFDSVEEKRKKEAPDDVHHKMFMQLTLGKRCEITEQSYFKTFRRRYKAGVPFLFQFVVPSENGAPRQVTGIPELVFYYLKIIEKRDLTRKDIEYDLIRILGD